jgi:hypothetical protein
MDIISKVQCVHAVTYMRVMWSLEGVQLLVIDIPPPICDGRVELNQLADRLTLINERTVQSGHQL